ncbi:MAG TPA: ECF-type sigma factor [Povalibacter sp.]|jgi:RNA polymerase sigma factor (TIGR02999 family)
MNAESSVLSLLPKVYDELRRIAATQMAGRPSGSTLQPTALVHEAWMRLGGADQPDWQNRAHFFAAATEAMRNVLIDRARARRTCKHGGGQTRVSVESIEIAAELEDEDSLLALSAAIDRLASEHPEMAQLVKLRCFTGLEVNQAALALGVSRATANRWWLFARTWLYRELHQ